MKEIWKDVKGYEGCYQVSNFGNVKSLNYMKTGKEKVLKVRKDKYGYLTVNLSKDGKKKHYTVHRLVATAFLPNPNNLLQVNHIDEDKTNNTVFNLEWCSNEYNHKYGTINKRIAISNTNHPKKSKKVICVETGKIYPSTHQVQRELGFSRGNISSVCAGRYKTAYGFHWRYTE